MINILIHTKFYQIYYYTSIDVDLQHFVKNHLISLKLIVRPGDPYPITRRQILDSSKLKGFADDSFKFDENGRKLSKWVENTVGKGEIALYEQFLLFPQCFQKACLQGVSKGVVVWEWVKVTQTYFGPTRCLRRRAFHRINI